MEGANCSHDVDKPDQVRPKTPYESHHHGEAGVSLNLSVIKFVVQHLQLSWVLQSTAQVIALKAIAPFKIAQIALNCIQVSSPDASSGYGSLRLRTPRVHYNNPNIS